MIGGQPELHCKFEAGVGYRVRRCLKEQTIHTYIHIYIHTNVSCCEDIEADKRNVNELELTFSQFEGCSRSLQHLVTLYALLGNRGR